MSKDIQGLAGHDGMIIERLIEKQDMTTYVYNRCAGSWKYNTETDFATRIL